MPLTASTRTRSVMVQALKRGAKAAAVALVACAATAAHAQTPAQTPAWPNRQITLVVPFAAGGPVDTIGRLLGQYLGEELGQQIAVENVGGAGGMIGAARVAKSDPDGYTMLVGGSTIQAQIHAIYKKPMVDGLNDFTMVSMFADSARLMLVRKDFPATNMTEFMTYAKANAGKMQYGSAGAGSGSHVCAVLVDGAIGQKIAHVPYRGSALAMQDLVAGRLDFVAEQISTAVGHVNSGAIRAIGVMGLDRVSVFPNLKTSIEEGFTSLDCGSWAAVVLPRGAPEPIVQRLAQAIDKVLDNPALRDRYETIGVAITPKTRRGPQFLAKYAPDEAERWGKAIRSAGISHD